MDEEKVGSSLSVCLSVSVSVFVLNMGAYMVVYIDRRHQSKFLTRMMDAISGEKSRANKTEERVNFSNFTEFVQMEVEEQKSSYGSLHWKPYVGE